MFVRASPCPTPEYEASYERALARAGKERLIASPHDDTTWFCKQYPITITGPNPEDVSCSCAGGIATVCKHAACVIFCRRHGVRPVGPARVA